ncbi:hypothetical protein KL943_005248 [Ogataea angusta]|nr:hypothetical protein KL943_005248 [Ogataea angusta]
MIITRKRLITSCKPCYLSKRKCGREKPECRRCARLGKNCDYFTEEQIIERTYSRKYKGQPRNKKQYDLGAERLDSNTQLVPETRTLEKKNFNLIISSTGEYSKYFSLFFFPFAEKESNVNTIVGLGHDDHDQCVAFDFTKPVKPLSGVRDLVERLPSREDCNFLVVYFFENIHPYIPIVDQEEFFIHYGQLWNTQEKYRDLNGLLEILAVLFSSSLVNQLSNMYHYGSMQHNSDKVDFETVKLNSFRAIENIKHWISIMNSPSMSSLVAATLIYYVGSLNCIGKNSEIASLSRLCQIAGLHRNFSTRSSGSSLRYILYSFVSYMDSLSSYYSGLPPTMHRDFCETYKNLPTDLDHHSSVYLSIQFHNGILWGDVIAEMNKIRVTTQSEYDSIFERFIDTQRLVNSLSHRLLNDFSLDPIYAKWLVTEGRLGVRKSALLINILRDSVMSSEDSLDDPSYSLLLQSLLLVNESIMKIELGLRCKPACLWVIRNSYPFQALTIILRHIQQHPNQEVNFRMLPVDEQYTADELSDYVNGDIRAPLVRRCVHSLEKIKVLWPAVLLTRFDGVIKVKNEVL